MRLFLCFWTLTLSIFFSTNMWAASTNTSSTWNLVNESHVKTTGERWIVPQAYSTFQVDLEKFREPLQNLPFIRTEAAKSSDIIIEIPMPDGCFQHFRMVKTQIMSPTLSAKFPFITTCAGFGVEDPTAKLILDITSKGIHGMILKADGSIFIDPYSDGNSDFYVVYHKKDFVTSKSFDCSTDSQHKLNQFPNEWKKATQVGEELRSYRLAVSANAEYSNFHGGTVDGIMAAIVTSINRVVGVYEQEVAVTMVLVDDNDELIFTGPVSNDPFNNTNSFLIIEQNQNVIDDIIGSNNYDIGHVFSTGGGGLANFECVCKNNSKAMAVTGSSNPVNDPFDIDYVAHEIGHQFGGSHTFNSSTPGCFEQGVAQTAYEPGGGSTIMAYAGICSGQNTQNASDPYFHGVSLDQITNYAINGFGNNCAEIISTNNTPPTADAGQGGFIIPIETPFELTGSGTDEDGDPILYCWEQWDLGPAGSPSQPSGNAPAFRSFSPTEDPLRTFPKLSAILINNNNPNGEVLPDYARNLLFRLTVRDYNEEAGGYGFDYTNLSVTDDAGPFAVHSVAETTWGAGSTQSISWDVANTDEAPINCSNVDILLSTDGGNTFPYTLASNSTNDGFVSFIVPNIASEECRVKVKAIDNVFFDITHNEITIVSPELAITNEAESTEICPENILNVPLNIEATYDFNGPVTLSVGDIPSVITASFSNNPIYPPAVPQLIIETNENIASGTINIQVTATSAVDTITTIIPITFINGTPLSSPFLASPSDGELAAASSPTFIWSNISNATYGIEIADSPTFGSSIVESKYDVTNNQYIATNIYENDIVYYWRVFSMNGCGSGTASQVFSFRTGVEDAPTQEPILNEGDQFVVNQGSEVIISEEYLAVTDNSDAEDLVYTLIGLPANGVLLLNGMPLAVGDTFTQEDINDGSLTYENDGVDNDSDAFVFDVQDDENGWIPSQTFDIVISEGVGIEETTIANQILIYPNPATDFLFIDLQQTYQQNINFTLYNLAGQAILVQENLVVEANQPIRIDIEQLPKGMYFYKVAFDGAVVSGALIF